MANVLVNMTKRLTIKEAITYLRLSEKTIRRHIKSGQLNAEKQGNQWFILVNDDPNHGHGGQKQGQTDYDNGQPDQPALIGQLQSENQHLREQVDHLTQVVAMSQKNIGALTEQLDDSRQMIEDMRQRRTVWQRIRGVFVAETA